ncbi:hypothetical protein [Candidatus Sulfurimonas baltica]|uniref:Uncharacterized protein n=1 Tax=Candidatus Sulfurimonas baltica TaxID=2740404 RepID=A0A7S7LTT1_9BACT|nr:hypothetical protein [Candidatus Sulfurimonas baltica]QOY51399.1 hypothetical protein HUE88_09745 [Candidatus Sulfurimonas baltica]
MIEIIEYNKELFFLNIKFNDKKYDIKGLTSIKKLFIKESYIDIKKVRVYNEDRTRLTPTEVTALQFLIYMDNTHDEAYDIIIKPYLAHWI